MLKKVGVFDSGIGGLSVAKSVLDHKLFSELIYYGDTARVPYGTKNPDTIIKYSLEALDFFEKFDVDILIFACNSVSAYGIEILQQNANFKIAGVIKAGVLDLTAKIEDKNSKILIIGTKATINSGKYQRLLKEQGFENTIAKETSLLVPLIEEGIDDGEILVIIF